MALSTNNIDGSGEAIVEYETGKYIRVGMANGSTDGKTLHIDDGGALSPGVEDMTFFIGVAEYDIDEQKYTGSASQALYDAVLATGHFEYDTNQIESVSRINPDERYHFEDKTVSGGIYTEDYIVKFKDISDTVILYYVFTYNQIEYKARIFYTVNSSETFSFKVKDIDSNPNTAIATLNKIFESRTALKDFLSTKEIELDYSHIYEFLFEPNVTYKGSLIVDCNNTQNAYSVELSTDTSGYEIEEPAYDPEALNLFVEYDEDFPRATIQGGIVSYGGLSSVSNINFVADDAITFDYDDNDITAGIVVTYSGEYNPENHGVSNDIYLAYNNSFKGYDVACLSYGDGLISGLEVNKFEDNDIAICIDSAHSNSYSDSFHNYFINNGVAIDLKTLPVVNPFQFVYAVNYYFDNTIDIRDAVEILGSFFFIDSYFGKDARVGFTNANVRNATVTYEPSAAGEVVTSPCIRYPESTASVYGFDTGEGVSNKLVNGKKVDVHLEDLYNLENDFSIDIYDANLGDVASLNFGGNN